jgi:hypothetical protein
MLKQGLANKALHEGVTVKILHRKENGKLVAFKVKVLK